MKRIIIIFIGLINFSMVSQQSLSLDDCYKLATLNYPLAKQFQLLATQNQLELEAITTAKFPQLSWDMQATYQSEVTEVPIPNTGINPPNKDQYRTTISVNQLIYNGGATDASLNLKSAQFKAKQKQVEVSLYQIKQKINQLYFSILLAQETDTLLKAKQNQLETKLKEVKSGITHGALLPASDKIIEAELLKLNQQFTEVKSSKSTLIKTLSELIGQPLDTSITFQNPLVETKINSDLNRPELDLFQLKKEEIESSEFLLSKQNAPKLVGFASGGYGNPGLNMLDNSFQVFYIVGAKLNWNIFDWNSNKKQRESLAINKNIIDTETETFKLNTTIELIQQQKEIEKIETFIISDLEIIKLREDILKSASSQLKNGVITTSAYITELTNLYEDQTNLMKHKIELQLAKANYNLIKGN